MFASLYSRPEQSRLSPIFRLVPIDGASGVRGASALISPASDAAGAGRPSSLWPGELEYH